MALVRSPDQPNPPPAPSGVGPAALSGSISAAVLWSLQRYVFHGEIPEDIALFVWTAVPAALAYLTGLAAHRRGCDPCSGRQELQQPPSDPTGPTG
jgi:hypothetical protein